jgi:Tetraspanin family
MSAGGVIISNSESDLIGLASTIGAASIVIGAIVSIISFLGCFGAANEKGLLLKTYFVFLIVLVILEISVGAAAYARRDQIPQQLDDAWVNAAKTPNSTALIEIQKQVIMSRKF